METWGRFVTRTAWVWLIAWPIVAFAVWWPAPRVQTLLADDDTGFLPPDMPSQQAAAVLRSEFPDQAPSSRVVALFVRETGLTGEDQAYIGHVARGLASRADELNWRVHAVAVAPYLAPILQNADGTAALVAVDLPAELLTHSSVRRVRVVQEALSRHERPSGLRTEVTGSAALGELLDANAKRDVDMTTVWAFAAVMLILLAIYRSPVAMLLPIVSIAVALMLSLGLVGWAASSWLEISGLVEMLIIVILVGSGVDYCLFLFARFREELGSGAETTRAVEVAVSRSGGAILASAGTNAAGLATLALAGNRDLHTCGPTIALAICVGTLAVLTLTPSLLTLVGPRLFWPSADSAVNREESRLWRAVAASVTRRPALVAVMTVSMLLPLAWVGLRVEPLYDAYEEFPADSSFVRGARLYADKFFGCEGVSEQTLVLSTDGRLDTDSAAPALMRTLDQIAESLAGRVPLLYQRDLGDPLGLSRRSDAPGAGEAVSGLLPSLTARLSREAYIGRSGKSTRIDLGVAIEPRSGEALDQIDTIREVVADAVAEAGLLEATGASSFRIDLTGDTPLYRDVSDLRRRDFRTVAIAAVVVIFAILLWLIRSPVQSAVLVMATMLTFLAAYGATWLVFWWWFGLDGLGYIVSFLLFIIILSLGQDYNIFVVTRIREELSGNEPEAAVEIAIRKTGRVVSSCGLIMAATFASMLSGSLVLMKEFAVAFALGILLDTFIVRPLLVPAVILLLVRRKRAKALPARV